MSPAADSNDSIKILIADDSDADRLILQTIIKGQGHEVITAVDGIDAIEKFTKEKPQIVLMDALMPRMNGFEAVPEIKKIAGNDMVPIIFLTSLTDADSLVQCLNSGGDDFLSKPYNPVILKAKINAFNRMRLNHQHLQKALEDLEQSQSKLVQREKMASLGELVAGIAHEVNTPIGIGVTAISHLQGLLKDLKNSYDQGELEAEDLEKFIQRADESANITQVNLDRSARLIKSFKQVAVDQSSDSLRDIALQDHMHDILMSLKPQIKKFHHHVQINCYQEIHCVCDAGALTQVMTNLIMNSIIHGFAHIDDGTITIDISLKDKTIYITYNDNGAGMAADLLTKIFEPFFTTRRGDGGSGLGTHIIYNQVSQALHGHISVKSSPGKGMTFSIDFPAKFSKT